ncbi:hypothetical protein QYE77_14695 (plasmid) [Thermanaerothrix sp. 4228-RoL]|uniref:Uncharacterized protein n=1 Tax=Thermanaerothrix solaris TaxID=3058434 RepID=A0ABU3NRP9_9CHLR|nr:hypothetical protein [Thermanaerothrix sp. 4228-RoL]MCX7590478.1 hypothetical protein [Kiritimatiellia bacterium]MDT8899510.1 hypothetical protein [Thermanaerothrix sp. 4228-RoL]
MKTSKTLPGSTTEFIWCRGIVRFEEHGVDALVSVDGSYRFLAELSADPDRPEVQPERAYQALLSALPPGRTLRFLQVIWVDPGQRLNFYRNFTARSVVTAETEELYRTMDEFLRSYPLPYSRRTYLEFAARGLAEELTWWLGIPGMMEMYGVRVQFLDAAKLVGLLRQVTNPGLSGHAQDVPR